MGTDFFDDDLVRADSRGEDETDDSNGVPVTPIADINISRLARQKQQMSQQVAGTVQKMEQLRGRQEQLEREKQDLEELGNRQQAYEEGKRDIISHMTRSLVLVEKEREQAARMVELLSETQTRLRETLHEIQAIDEEKWPEEDFAGELAESLERVRSAHQMYDKAMARIEASSWHKVAQGEKKSELLREVERELHPQNSFGFWLKAGLAASLPVAVVMIILFVAWIVVSLSLGI